MKRILYIGVLLVFCLLSSMVCGADKYWSGSGTWTTGGAGQWSTNSGGGYGSAVWNDGDSAIFEGAAGAVTVSGSVTVSNITFTAGDYTIQGGVLSFLSGVRVDHRAEDKVITFTGGIAGEPEMRIRAGAHNPYNILKLLPVSSTQAVGLIVSPYYENLWPGDKGYVTFGGSTAGNTAVGVTRINTDPDTGTSGNGLHYGVVESAGSGTWTVGSITNGICRINSGSFIINGMMTLLYSGLDPIASGARLGGNFTYNKPDSRSGHFRVSSGGIVAPGDPAVSNGVGAIIVQHGSTGTPQPVNVFNDGAIYEWQVGPADTDKIHFVYGANTRTLDLNNFILKIFDAGGAPKVNDHLPVFTYDIGVTVDMAGFSNTVANFDTTAVEPWAGGPLSLVDDGAGIIYLTGLNAPAKGMVLIIK